MKIVFRNDLGKCFLDEPQEHNFKLPEMPAGVVYDARWQCTHLFGPSEPCDMGPVSVNSSSKCNIFIIIISVIFMALLLESTGQMKSSLSFPNPFSWVYQYTFSHLELFCVK